MSRVTGRTNRIPATDPPEPAESLKNDARTLAQLILRGVIVGLGVFSLLGLGAVSTLMIGKPVPSLPALTAPLSSDSASVALATSEAELKEIRQELERAHQVLDYSARYDIPADLAALIYDNALAEGITPAIGFRLVKIESNFQSTAASPMAAIGLTQLQLATARGYDPSLEASDLMNSQTNLRIGFRYLRDLLRQFDNDIALALEAYNKGPTVVAMQRADGITVKGRYSSAILQNY